MGVAIDKVQEFRTIARYAGKDLGFFESVFNKLNVSAGQALGGDKKASLLKTWSYR